MRGHATPALLAVICILAAAFAVSRAAAQNTTTAAPPDSLGCNTVAKPATAGGASLVQATGESLQHKNCQPAGGEVPLTVKSFVPIPSDASVYVCFRWKRGGDSQDSFIETRPTLLDLSADGKLLKVTARVPEGLRSPPSDVARALPLVPYAELRILAVDNKKKEVAADVTTTIGVTYVLAALVLAGATAALGMLVLYLAVHRRLTHPGILRANWFLRIISTPSGFSSLSQLQIALWTFVVAASAVYVMSLSGQLVEVTSGMLMLLGIAGAAALGAKANDEASGASAESAATKAAANKAKADLAAAQAAAAAAAAPADPATIAARNQAAADASAKAELANAARARAAARTDPPAEQVPQWSDLIVNETVKEDGTKTREIDVTRFQMLFFTLITAIFVLMTVATTYIVPEISTGFVALMGISNGVYLGSKVVQRA
jgi:hypothetical protein